MSDVEVDEMVFEIDDDNDDVQDIDESDLDVEGPGVTKATSVDTMATTDDSLYIVYAKQLLSLARIQVEAVCRSCRTQLKIDSFVKGSAIYITWVREWVAYEPAHVISNNLAFHMGILRSAYAAYF